MAFRYIEDDNKDFAGGMYHKNIMPIPYDKKYLVLMRLILIKQFSGNLRTLRIRSWELCCLEEWILQILWRICAAVMRIHSGFWVENFRAMNLKEKKNLQIIMI